MVADLLHGAGNAKRPVNDFNLLGAAKSVLAKIPVGGTDFLPPI